MNLPKPNKSKLTKIIIGIIIALIIALISGLNTAANMPKKVNVQKYELIKHELSLLKSDRTFRACFGCSHYDANTNTCISNDKWSKWCEANFPTNTLDERWYPGELNSSGNAQEMPVLTSAESHQRFIELCEKYDLPADVIWHTENYYGLKEGTILCIAIAETSGGKKGYGVPGCWNYGNVGNNDAGDRHCFANQGAGLAAIGRTLNNSLLGNNQTISCLNGAGECIEPNASGKRYSTGTSGNRQRNMIGCFYTIYQQKINPQTFNLHQR